MKSILSLALLLLSVSLFADTKPYTFRVVEQSTKTPISKAFIRVVNLTDHNRITGATSDEQGFVAINLDINHKYRVDVGKRADDKNTKFITYSFFLNGTEMLKNSVAEITLEKVQINSQVTLANLYYDFERTELNGADKMALANTLITLKNSPDMIIEIGVHADCKESTDVSAKRLEAIQTYFANKGELAKRVVIKDYGKDYQLGGCNCNSPVIYPEEVYTQNRVAEFRVLNF